MDMPTGVSSSVHDNEVVINFEDVTGGLLIGRKGQTLDALEYLLNRIVTKNDDNEAHLLLDAAGYRERRRQNLESLAMRLGERAKRRRRTVTLSPLNPRDRRIIHLALEGDPLVTTKSMDRGYLRRLSIIPEEAARRERGRQAER
jgi:spoIIIJ-associated protein